MTEPTTIPIEGGAWGEIARIAATLVLGDGTVLEGHLHLQAHSPLRDGPETPLELLNRAEPFLALSTAGGPVFVSKDQLAATIVPAEPPVDTERDAPGKRVTIEVVLLGGATHRGWAVLDLPPTRVRTLDYLNWSARFFAVRSDAGTAFVNRSHVRLVRPLD